MYMAVVYDSHMHFLLAGPRRCISSALLKPLLRDKTAASSFMDLRERERERIIDLFLQQPHQPTPSEVDDVTMYASTFDLLRQSGRNEMQKTLFTQRSTVETPLVIEVSA